MESIIRVKELKKSFKTGMFHTPVLRGVNLEIGESEFVIIFGPSGAGKSTILNIILGLEDPTAGTVSVFGNNIYELNSDKRAELRREKFGVIYQLANWVKSLNVIENVAFPLLAGGCSERKAIKKAGEELELVNMYRFAKYSPTELSGGQQQKVSLARALISDPQVIVGDEPTGNLDTESGDELMDILKALSAYQKKTVAVVTHDSEYKKYADRIISVKDGFVKTLKIEGKKAMAEAKKGFDLLNLNPEERLKRDIKKTI